MRMVWIVRMMMVRIREEVARVVRVRKMDGERVRARNQSFSVEIIGLSGKFC